MQITTIQVKNTILTVFLNICTTLGHLLERKWENCMTLDINAWGYRRDMNVSYSNFNMD